MEKVIEATVMEPPQAQPQTMALQRSDGQGGALSTKAMTVEELHERLEFVRNVMRNEMKEEQDFGKIPGAGDRKTLLQPGAQKLLMVFNLTVQVKKEVLREFPNMDIAMHREYEFVLTIQAPNGKSWDGVGTCSTLEKKYRYRKGKRVCPECRKETIILGKPEYGGGWICYGKKGGCGAKYEEDDERITSQSIEDAENEDPAEVWNTVRKMAYKRALVHGAINATNTSELWTQDVEDMDPGDLPGGVRKSSKPKSGRTVASPPREQKKPYVAPKAAQPPLKPELFPTVAGRAKLIELLNKSDMADIATEYFRKRDGCLLPTEGLGSLPLQWVPVTTRQMWELNKAIEAFGNGDPAHEAFPPNKLAPTPAPEPKKTAAKPPEEPKGKPKAIEVPRDANPDPDSPDAPWRSFPMPFGNSSGVPIAKLDKKYLFGLWANWQPKAQWEGSDGRMHDTKPEKLATERKFREMLDEAGKHYGFKLDEDGLDEPYPEPDRPTSAEAMSEADDNVPF